MCIRDRHPTQAVLAVAGGSQCGYCTPGFVSSLAGEYYRADRTPGQHGCGNGVHLEALAGNLCRCTGYRPIKDAALAIESPPADDPWVERLAQPSSWPSPVSVSDAAGAVVRPASLAEAFDAPVSYTHLDVYKRQPPGSPCSPPRTPRAGS